MPPQSLGILGYMPLAGQVLYPIPLLEHPELPTNLLVLLGTSTPLPNATICVGGSGPCAIAVAVALAASFHQL